MLSTQHYYYFFVICNTLCLLYNIHLGYVFGKKYAFVYENKIKRQYNYICKNRRLTRYIVAANAHFYSVRGISVFFSHSAAVIDLINNLTNSTMIFTTRFISYIMILNTYLYCVHIYYYTSRITRLHPGKNRLYI